MPSWGPKADMAHSGSATGGKPVLLKRGPLLRYIILNYIILYIYSITCIYILYIQCVYILYIYTPLFEFQRTKIRSSCVSFKRNIYIVAQLVQDVATVATTTAMCFVHLRSPEQSSDCMTWIPIGSMYGIYANIGDILMVNVTIYSIHGSYGICCFPQLLLLGSYAHTCSASIPPNFDDMCLSLPIGSMLLLYMVTWIPSIYPKCQHIYQHHGSYGLFIPIFSHTPFPHALTAFRAAAKASTRPIATWQHEVALSTRKVPVGGAQARTSADGYRGYGKTWLHCFCWGKNDCRSVVKVSGIQKRNVQQTWGGHHQPSRFNQLFWSLTPTNQPCYAWWEKDLNTSRNGVCMQKK